jgi:hypothetical protein
MRWSPPLVRGVSEGLLELVALAVLPPHRLATWNMLVVTAQPRLRSIQVLAVVVLALEETVQEELTEPMQLVALEARPMPMH